MRMGVWVPGGGRYVVTTPCCNCDLLSRARALDPLTFGVSQQTSLLTDTTTLLEQSIR